MNENNENGQKAPGKRSSESMYFGEHVQEGKNVLRERQESGVDMPGREFSDTRVSSGEKSNSVNGFGQLLRTERLKRGLSISEVARRLRLSVQKVHAIEEEDYSKLPSGVFLRGFVRNYSNLLQLDTDALLRLLAPSKAAASPHKFIKSKSTVPLTAPRRSHGGRNILGITMVLVLALLGYGIYQGGDWDQESITILKESTGGLSDSQTEQGQVTRELFLPQATLAPSPLPSPSIEKQPLVEMRSPEESTEPVAPSPVDPAVTESVESNEKTLYFTFSKDSWVEVRDSDRKVIFVKTNPKGTEQVITGVPPFYLVIGNASGVNLTYNGRVVETAPYTRKSDDVARFSLE